MQNDSMQHTVRRFISNGIVPILAFLTIVSIAGAFFLIDHSDKLERELIYKDSLIRRIQRNDSLYNNSVKGYSEVIERYISDCNFILNGKKISTEELVKLANHTLNENEILKDSIRYYKLLWLKSQISLSESQLKYDSTYDSLFVNGAIVSFIKKRYGISYAYVRKGDKYTFTKNSSKVDSALILFPYFKDRLKGDSTGIHWTITTGITSELVVPPKKRKRKKD